jgi:malate synthase
MDAGGAKITRQDIWNWLKKGTKLDKSATTARGRPELLAKASAASGVDPSFMTDGPGERISSQTHIGEQLEAAAEQAP